MDVTRQTYAAAVWEACHLPATAENVSALVAVMDQENTAAAWNPCATTLHEPGSEDLPGNVAHVQEYPSYQEGVEATAATLQNGDYQPVLRAASAGQDGAGVVTAWAQGPWGTWGGPNGDTAAAVAKFDSVQADPAASYNVVVGSEPEPAPAPAPGEGIVVEVSELSESSPGPDTESGQVKTVQAVLLGKWGVNAGAIDGRFGPTTAAAVRQFQQDHGLAPDGIVGAQTWPALVS